MDDMAMLTDDDDDMIAACEEWETSQITDNIVTDSEHFKSPLTQIRNGYLWVSDLCSQLWCEQQNEYKLTAPSKEPESEQMTKGTELHLARELETQDYVDVEITSDEDIFAVKVINLSHALLGFIENTQTISREVPIFGALGEDEIFFLGKIDEVNMKDGSNLEIIEFKTRTRNVLPGKAQKQTHDIQVMAYKELLDKLIRDGLQPDKLYAVLGLDGKKKLGKSVLKHCKGVVKSKKASSLDDLINNLNATAKFLPLVMSMKINYTSQTDGKCFAEEEVKYDKEWFSNKLNDLLSYWHGKRNVQGVDIEDAWKCQNCFYANDCTWRKTKAEEIVQRNKLKNKE